MIAIASLFVVALAAPPSDAVPDPRRAASPDSAASHTLAVDTDELERILRESPLGKGLVPVAGGLTDDAVAERAVAASPSLQIKQEAIERAAARVDQAIVSFLPTLGVKASYSRLSKAAINFGGGASVAAVNGPSEGVAPITVGDCPGGQGQCALDPQGVPLVITPPFKIQIPLNSYSLSANLSVPISDYILSLAPARKGTLAARESAVFARDAERVKVQTDARLAYYNWLRGVASLVVIEDSLQRTQSRLVDAENLFNAGSATRSDVLRVDALVSSQQSAIADARAFRKVAERNLAVMMNEPTRAYDVGEDILAPPPDLGELPTVDDLITEAQAQRLEVRSLERAVDGTHQNIRATRAGYYPRLDAFADALYANPNQRFFPLSPVWRASWSVGVQLSYTINQSLRTKAQVRELKTNKRELVLQAELMRRAIAMEVAQAYHDRERALAAIELSTRGLASSVEAYRVASENYKLGAATTNEIIAAEGEQVQAALRAVNSRIDLHVATTRLLYATGRLNPK
ncbi:TolC family protein [Nannocystis sp. ILAH1]|uniref:TolC family protein n=1 Tax=unclassified Nannocystis TaxID=2627009 RepID=UPI00226DCB40|nr:MULTISPECIES: TolC family protein [unclassified Nannocystis]MCY0988719.1 TolC family protein [Nannocystis sp. ILAH1]MCY1072496.1 TolC family protein [Nannocystis sp. RBIL2]